MRHHFRLKLQRCFAVASTIALPTSLLGQTETCVDHAQLVAASHSELNDLQPCDMLGGLYLIGLGIAVPNVEGMNNDSTSSQYPYYWAFRGYLSGQKRLGGYSSSEQVGLLMMGLAQLPSISNSQNVNELRGNYYSAYAVLQYWDEHIVMSRDLPWLFSEASQDWMKNGPFSNFHQLNCFIRHDLPTLSVEEIISSRRFNVCSGGS